MRSAQPSADGDSAEPLGLQLKMILRLSLSETPVIFSGPVIASSMMCGGAVVPALPLRLPASEKSCGLIRSS
jgi:hypothetical protein